MGLIKLKVRYFDAFYMTSNTSGKGDPLKENNVDEVKYN
jgi:hypothetical protein